MATTQKGEQLDIGIGGYTYTGYIVEDVTITPTAEIDVIKDEDNATVTKLISDPGETLNINCIIKNGSSVNFDIGDSITINGTTYMLDTGSSVSRSRGAARLTLSLIKEDSMTYTV